MSVGPISDEPLHQNEAECADMKKSKSSLWTRLKHKWKHQGVEEIDQNHHHYELLNCVREGLQNLLVNHPELGPKLMLTDEDYTSVCRETFTSPSGKKFVFTSHSSRVFASIRRAVGISEEEYKNTLAPPSIPYLQYISNSKGGAKFFLSHDKAYFLKTEKPHYITILKNMLRDYLHHFIAYPHSLIVKIIGLYSIKVDGEKTMHFFVMQSIFYPDRRIRHRYDLKGCFVGRYQKPEEPESEILTVLKDENFKNDKIRLGQQKDWFLKQIRLDTEFLISLGVLDYSLLVGHHALLPGESEKKLGDVVIRTRNSIVGGKTIQRKSLRNSLMPTMPGSPERRRASVSGEEGTQDNKETDDDFIEAESGFFSLISDEDANAFQNRRLLPSSRNPLHVINGDNDRYFLGIIDFLTLYECRQRAGKIVKTLKHFSCGHSTQSPAVYGDRFLNFFQDHTL